MKKSEGRRKGIGILTHRQAEVMRYRAMGFSQEEISQQLGISQPRVSAALKAAEEKVRLAKETLEFYNEITYIEKLRKAGFKGEVILGSEKPG
jgi:transcriptional regulator